MNTSKTILFSVLDWGLGHAARCIPIITYLNGLGYQIKLVSSDKAGQLLQKQFPNLDYIEFPSYGITYAQNHRTDWKIALQVPKIVRAIKQEHALLLNLCEEYSIDFIISDNRFGCYHPTIPSAFISHQLNLQTGVFQPFSRIVNAFQWKFINRFSECWVPDDEQIHLSGILSEANDAKIPVYYLGVLSRSFVMEEKKAYAYPFLFILSGPEPQRTLFEQKIVSLLQQSPYTAMIVRGTKEKTRVSFPASCKVFDFVTEAELQAIVNDAEIVISRSGYSSVMDAAKWQKKWAFCPTPGQPEQEYLAERLSEKFGMCTFSAQDFSLEMILEKAKKLQIEKQSSTFEGILNRFLYNT